MKKTTLSKFATTLCLTTLITSNFAQISYAYKPNTSCTSCKKSLNTQNSNSVPLPITLKSKKINSKHLELMLKHAKKANMLHLILTTKDKNGRTILNYAIDNEKSFEIILKYAKDIDILKEVLTSADNTGKTILMHAVTYKDDNPIINLILSYAGKNNILNEVLNAYHKPSTYENSKKEPQIIQGSVTALTYAIQSNHFKNAKKLINYNCNGVNCVIKIFNPKNGLFITYPVFEYLSKYKNFDMIKLLVENKKLIDTIHTSQDQEDLSKHIKNNDKKALFNLIDKMAKPKTFHILPTK